MFRGDNPCSPGRSLLTFCTLIPYYQNLEHQSAYHNVLHLVSRCCRVNPFSFVMSAIVPPPYTYSLRVAKLDPKVNSRRTTKIENLVVRFLGMNFFLVNSITKKSGGQPGLNSWLSSLIFLSQRTGGRLNFATLSLIKMLLL